MPDEQALLLVDLPSFNPSSEQPSQRGRGERPNHAQSKGLSFYFSELIGLDFARSTGRFSGEQWSDWPPFPSPEQCGTKHEMDKCCIGEPVFERGKQTTS